MITKKQIVALATGAAITTSLAIGGSLLTPKPVEDISPIPTQDTIISSVVVSPLPTPVASATPKPSVKPTPTIKAVATPQPTEAPVEVLDITKEKPISTLEKYGISGNTIVEGTYIIKKMDSSRTEFSITVPEKLSADIYELYLNNQFVDKQLILQGKIIAPPVIFTNPELLEVEIFKLQEVIAIGRFENGKLIIAVKDGVIND